MQPDNRKLLQVFLYLVALHSFCVGLGLVLIPLDYYSIFGYTGYQGNFFKIQAGVFHFVMVGAYLPAAIQPVKGKPLIAFAIFAKFSATVFLLSYSFFAEMIWMVFASGIFDFILGLILLWFYLKISDGSG